MGIGNAEQLPCRCNLKVAHYPGDSCRKRVAGPSPHHSGQGGANCADGEGAGPSPHHSGQGGANCADGEGAGPSTALPSSVRVNRTRRRRKRYARVRVCLRHDCPSKLPSLRASGRACVRASRVKSRALTRVASARRPLRGQRPAFAIESASARQAKARCRASRSRSPGRKNRGRPPSYLRAGRRYI